MPAKVVLMVSSAIMNDGKLLVVRRSSHEEFLPGYWTITGGKFEEFDASVADGVHREALEETGLDVEVVRPLIVDEFRRDDRPGVVAVEITFLCVPREIKNIRLSPDEHDVYRWIREEEIDSLDPMTDFTRSKLKKFFV